jgi:poly-beta-1,6-N-acetyl-D-glucosamine synthase
MTTLPTYVLITPARNEAKFIELTLKSMVAQTIKPLRWVIVSDGSTDGTDEIIKKYTSPHEWIELLSLPVHQQRSFAGKVTAFNAGYEKVKGLDYEVIGNLDGDISFEPGYLEFLVNKFAENPKLGVAGTPYKENEAVHDERFKSPDHVSGACQMFRRQCFEEIGGFPAIKTGGVDLIALLSAQAKGWQTKRFDEMSCMHHRNVGSGDHSGVLRRLLNRGRKDYLLGSHPAFEIFRGILQMKNRPFIVGGTLMIFGYFWAMVCCVKRSMPKELIIIRQHDQMERLRDALRHPFRRNGQRAAAAVRS